MLCSIRELKPNSLLNVSLLQILSTQSVYFNKFEKKLQDYNCSVEFFWSPFLVKLETKQDQKKALKLDQLPTMLKQVVGADVIVFNTGHWWTHTGKLRA
jgi:hypothetical protein